MRVVKTLGGYGAPARSASTAYPTALLSPRTITQDRGT